MGCMQCWLMLSRKVEPKPSSLRSCEVRLRDPFVWVSREEQRYYLYGTTDSDPWHAKGVGFDAYWSCDLELWHGPHEVLRPPEGFWGNKNFWAPEVYRRENDFVLFASFNSESRRRGVQAFLSQGPLGPFREHGSPLTPESWECLDPTLFYQDGDPWLVFCHEWLQIDDGAICAVQLSADLSRAVAEPRVLFRASSAPWVWPAQDRCHFVTDGPFVHRNAGGKLLLLWSSFARRGYALGLAVSESGRLEGPWIHQRRPLVAPGFRRAEGGHGMLFENLDNQLMLAFHSPNRTPDERPVFLPARDHGERLRLGRVGGIGGSLAFRWRWWRR